MINLKKRDILPLVANYLPEAPLIVEAGSYNGKDTKRMSRFFPKATIHAFEPVPEIFAELTKKTTEHPNNFPNIHRHNVALGSSNGHATFHVSEKPTRPGVPFQAGSLFPPKERLKISPITFDRTITVPTITLDTWAEHNNIEHVDFLWLDTQGTELSILQASPRTLSTVRVIFTEVEFIEAYAGQPQRDEVIAWVESQGFTCVANDFNENSTGTVFFGNVMFVRNELC
jgi:FkbM family methyltransferase